MPLGRIYFHIIAFIHLSHALRGIHCTSKSQRNTKFPIKGRWERTLKTSLETSSPKHKRAFSSRSFCWIYHRKANQRGLEIPEDESLECLFKFFILIFTTMCSQMQKFTLSVCEHDMRQFWVLKFPLKYTSTCCFWAFS